MRQWAYFIPTFFSLTPSFIQGKGNFSKERTQVTGRENKQLERRGVMPKLHVRHEIKCCPIMSPVINVYTDVSFTNTYNSMKYINYSVCKYFDKYFWNQQIKISKISF